MRLLILEDDPQLGEALAVGLRQVGHAVDWFAEGALADSAIADAPYDALVLDRGGVAYRATSQALLADPAPLDTWLGVSAGH